MTLYFISGNQNKLKEARAILNDDTVLSYDLVLTEIQANSTEIAKHKATQAYNKLKKPCFVDDTALCFNALSGLPGEYIRYFLEKLGTKNLYSLLDGFKDKSGYALCVIAYHDGKSVHVFEGRVDGTIVEPKGKNAFGWDSIFLPSGYDQTYAQMNSDQKNAISHRKKAFEKFKQFLNIRTK